MRKSAFFPGHIHLKTAFCTNTCDASLLPVFRKSRKQEYLIQMALQQHLGDSARTAEISIDLEYPRNT